MFEYKKQVKRVLDYLVNYENYDFGVELSKVEPIHSEFLLLRFNEFSFFLQVSRVQVDNKHYLLLRPDYPYWHAKKDSENVVYVCSKNMIFDMTFKEHLQLFKDKNLSVSTICFDLFSRYKGIVEFKDDKNCLKLWAEIVSSVHHKTLVIDSKRSQKYSMLLIKRSAIEFRPRFVYYEFQSFFELVRRIMRALEQPLRFLGFR